MNDPLWVNCQDVSSWGIWAWSCPVDMDLRLEAITTMSPPIPRKLFWVKSLHVWIWLSETHREEGWLIRSKVTSTKWYKESKSKSWFKFPFITFLKLFWILFFFCKANQFKSQFAFLHYYLFVWIVLFVKINFTGEFC